MTSTSFAIKALRFYNDFRSPLVKAAAVTNSWVNSHNRSYSINPIDLPKTMATEKVLPKLFNFVDQNVQCYKTLLKEAVAIPSVSSDAKYRDDCVRMVHWMQEKLKDVGAATELRDVGYQTIDGKEIKLPPVLIGTLGKVSTDNTVTSNNVYEFTLFYNF